MLLLFFLQTPGVNAVVKFCSLVFSLPLPSLPTTGQSGNGHDKCVEVSSACVFRHSTRDETPLTAFITGTANRYIYISYEESPA